MCTPSFFPSEEVLVLLATLPLSISLSKTKVHFFFNYNWNSFRQSKAMFLKILNRFGLTFLFLFRVIPHSCLSPQLSQKSDDGDQFLHRFDQVVCRCNPDTALWTGLGKHECSCHIDECGWLSVLTHNRDLENNDNILNTSFKVG